MIIVISNPTSVQDEHVIINQLFDEGLEFFHLRKPGSSINKMSTLLKKINSKYHSRIALHQHYELAGSFEIQRFHYAEDKRRQLSENAIMKHKINGNILSSSVHDPEEYKSISSSFDYVFFGPVFNSISKPDYNSILKSDFKIPSSRKTKMIALGGIDSSKIDKVKDFGFDGIGVLGTVWSASQNAVDNFKKIKEKWES